MAQLERWLGGSPGAVLLKLVVLSLIVGVVLATLGLTPLGLLHEAGNAFRAVFGWGLESVRNFGAYLATGALIVVPVWFLGRLLAGRR